MLTDRVTICGPANVGKTCLFSLLKGENIPEFFRTTRISSHFSFQCQDEDNKSYNINIWDVGGDKLIRNLAELYITNIDCAIIVFDLSNQESLENALNLTIFLHKSKGNEEEIRLNDDSISRSWIESVYLRSPKAMILVIGNKKDKKNISDDLIRQKLSACQNRFKKIKIDYIEISCTDNSSDDINYVIEKLKNIGIEIERRNRFPKINESCKNKPKKKENKKKKCLIE